MLKSATALVRAAALVLIGAALFTGPSATGSARTLQVICFVVGTVTVAIWAVSDWRQADDALPARPGWFMALFVVMAAASVATTTAHGGALISFAMLAAVAAGAAEGSVGAWAVAAVGVLAITVSAIATNAAPVSTLGDCLEVVVALLLGTSRRSYRIRADQSAQLLAQADQLRDEQARVATLTERARIAREIHDVLAHSLGALNIQIQAARALLSEQHDVEQASTVLNRAQRIATEGLDETRRAVHALRNDTRPLDDELAALAESHRLTHRVPVTVEVRGDVRPLPPETSLALLRTAQESLVNAAKHSPGHAITLVLTYDPERTHLQVSNPLRSDDASTRAGTDLDTVNGGYGLLGMRERLLLLHGTLTASTQAGTWQVTAQVPR